MHGGNVARRRRNRVAINLRVDTSALPFFAYRVNRNPEHLVVAEHPGRETDLGRSRIASPGRDLVQPFLETLPGASLVRMSGIRTDEMFELEALLEHGVGHCVGGLLLSVDLARVRDDRYVEGVDRVVGRVVHVPERPLHGVLGLAREPAAQEYFRL